MSQRCCVICQRMDLAMKAHHLDTPLGDLCEGHYQANLREVWIGVIKDICGRCFRPGKEHRKVGQFGEFTIMGCPPTPADSFI